MIVIKFGGSSLKDSSKIEAVASIIRNLARQKPIVVLSALGNTTDQLKKLASHALNGPADPTALINFHKQICQDLHVDWEKIIAPLFGELEKLIYGIHLIKELTPKTQDVLLSIGERLSVKIVAAFLSKTLPATSFTAWEIGLQTDNSFTDAKVLENSYSAIKAFFQKHTDTIPIITGFIGKSTEGFVTTLGRGGSDLTASIIGKAVQAKEIQVWKDVDGMMTADPKLIPSAKLITEISFEEASELAYFGAKIFHPRAVLPAMEASIPVYVKNTLKPSYPGTRVVQKTSHRPLMTALTCKQQVTLVDINSTRMLGQHGFLSRLFHVFDELAISVDVIATSEVSVSLTLDKPKKLDQLAQELGKFSHVMIQQDKAIITLVGNITHSTEILKRVFAVLYEEHIPVQMLSCGASKVNLSFIVDQEMASRAIISLHNHFFEKGN